MDEDHSAKKGRSGIHLERFISLIPVPYYLGWSLFAAAFLSISCLVLLAFEKSLSQIEVFPIVSAIIVLEGTAINWTHDKIRSFDEILKNVIDLPNDAIRRAHERQEAEIFNEKRLTIFAIIFIIVVHISGIDYHELSFRSSLSYLAFNFGYYFAVYLMGIGLYLLFKTAQTVYRIGKMPLKVDALFSDFQAIGTLYSKFTIYAASAYVMWGFFHMVVPPRFSSLQLMLWFFGFTLLLFAYFIIPQYSIHGMMSSTKKEKIEIFSSRLKAAMDESFRVPTEENVSHLKDMLAVQDQLDRMCDWPFGKYDMLRIALIIIVPLVILFLEMIYGIIK